MSTLPPAPQPQRSVSEHYRRNGKRDQRFIVKVTEHERRIFDKLAALNHLPLGTYVRNLLYREIDAVKGAKKTKAA